MGMMINRRRVMGGGEKGFLAGAIDMGLPSGTLWAQGNICKDAQGNYSIGVPSDYGCFFSWGNIDGYYWNSNSDKEDYNFNSYNYNLTPGSQLTASIANNDAEHDAAVARLGNGWHMPTQDNFQELFSSVNCSWSKAIINGINVLHVVSKRNGNELFFPYTGLRINSYIHYRENYGDYVSSTLYSATQAHDTSFNSEGYVTVLWRNPRYYGFPIRPVYTPNN